MWLARGDSWVQQQIAGQADKQAKWIASNSSRVLY